MNGAESHEPEQSMSIATPNNGEMSAISLDEKRANATEQRILREVVRRCALETGTPALAARPTTGAAASGPPREYLTRAEAASIVDDAITEARSSGDETMHTYVSGHRERLIRSLASIPKATGPGQSLLDVGCYGYMMLWAEKHLGYDTVEGVELRPDRDEVVMTRLIVLGREAFEYKVHNIDISKPDWEIGDRYDTVLFFETLEHVNEDPMGIMERIAQRMPMGGALVMSVPNCASYKAVRELLVGMPPWTYWFYHPDLEHEPRHAFEYTPIVFRTLVASAGFDEDRFFSLYAYSSEEYEKPVREIAAHAGMDVTHFGETMLCRAFKTSSTVRVRYPSVLYDPDRYYEFAYPIIARSLGGTIDRAADRSGERLSTRIEELAFACNAHVEREYELQAQIDALTARLGGPTFEKLSAENETLKTQVDELMFTLDLHMERSSASDAQRAMLESDRADAENRCAALAEENGSLRARIDELLFACDLYMQRVDDPGYCATVIRRNYLRRVVDIAKRTARRTPIVRSVSRKPYNYLKRVVKSRL